MHGHVAPWPGAGSLSVPSHAVSTANLQGRLRLHSITFGEANQKPTPVCHIKPVLLPNGNHPQQDPHNSASNRRTSKLASHVLAPPTCDVHHQRPIHSPISYTAVQSQTIPGGTYVAAQHAPHALQAPDGAGAHQVHTLLARHGPSGHELPVGHRLCHDVLVPNLRAVESVRGFPTRLSARCLGLVSTAPLCRLGVPPLRCLQCRPSIATADRADWTPAAEPRCMKPPGALSSD